MFWLFGIFLILLALGVEREAVMRDYLLTNEFYRMPVFHEARVSPEVLNVLWRVQEDFLDAALLAVEQDFGGVERYFEQRLNIGAGERKRLRALYLQDV